MVDGRKNNGGNKNAGRKPKADEDKVNNLFNTALRQLYKKKTDDNAKVSFIHTLLESQRGQIFVAEHIFGKPKENVNQTITLNNFDVNKLYDSEAQENLE